MLLRFTNRNNCRNMHKTFQNAMHALEPFANTNRDNPAVHALCDSWNAVFSADADGSQTRRLAIVNGIIAEHHPNVQDGSAAWKAYVRAVNLMRLHLTTYAAREADSSRKLTAQPISRM